jgi:iduronate 2-sulfatase
VRPALLALLLVVTRAAAGPNVLFIVADDLRADLGCYGGPALSPNIDALAGRGVRFDRAYCQQALCNPSRSSFLTGRRPDDLRLWHNGLHFRDKNPDVATLPGWFKQHGYVTRDVGKIFHNWHTKEKGDRRSWSADEFLYYATHGDDFPKADPLPPNLARPLRGRDYGNVPMCEKRDVPDDAYYDGRVAAEAVRVLGEVKDKPFFLAVGFWKPHAPFNAPKKYWDLYDSAKLPPAEPPARPAGAPDVAFHDGREILGVPPKNVRPTADEAAAMRHGYLANISYMDAQVGKVLDALKQSGVADDTVVVFLADHGYHVGEHTLWGKTSNFEKDARVPLIVVLPKATGRTAKGLAELVDLFPTLTGLCGLPSPPGLAGTPLPVADPSAPGKPAAFTQHPRPAYFDRTPKGIPEAMGYSVRTDKVRYTEWRDWATGKVVAAELYDAVGDPNETRNRVDNPPDVKDLADARAALHKKFPPGSVPAK